MTRQAIAPLQASQGATDERKAPRNRKHSSKMNFESATQVCERFGLMFPEL